MILNMTKKQSIRTAFVTNETSALHNTRLVNSILPTAQDLYLICQSKQLTHIKSYANYMYLNNFKIVEITRVTLSIPHIGLTKRLILRVMSE